MAVTPIKHAFQSAKPDGGDTALVRPSNWNDLHKVGSYTASVAPMAIASSDATNEEKANALLSNGAVTNDTNDETELQVANDA